jgi:glycolate dehydrogenase FAD-binding subunit
VKAGGRVVKNVAGYDLGKLHIGALGTLGVIVQTTFKVAPLPAATSDIEMTAPMTHVMSITSRFVEDRLAVESIVVENGAGSPDWTLRARFAGSAAAVERSKREAEALPRGSEKISERAATSDGPSPAAPGVLVKISVVPTAVGGICAAMNEEGAHVTAYPTAGIVFAAWADGDAVSLKSLRDLRRAAVESGQGALVLERGPVEMKRALGVWGEPRGDFGLMRRLKDEFDPKRTLSPGRFVGGI